MCKQPVAVLKYAPVSLIKPGNPVKLKAAGTGYAEVRERGDFDPEPDEA